MAATKSNIIANFSGKIITAGLGIIFVPIYLNYLSVEVYGIIGFFVSIQAFLSLLDVGISPTLNREVARLSAFPEKSQELRDVSRTLEVLCWVSAVTACVAALLLSPLIANYWLNSETIPVETVREALILMSLTFAFQWSSGFYSGGLLGLQQQKLLNLISVSLGFLRSFGAFLVLAYVSASINAFLFWQLVVSVLNCFLVFFFFWQKLPRSGAKPKFRLSELKQIWKYAFGMFGLSVTYLLLAQLDKLVLSRMLSLENFGYYMLALNLGNTILLIVGDSISNVYFPQFTRLAASGQTTDLARLYHQACQIMSFFLLPIAMILIFFSHPILLLWTRKIKVADNAAILLTLITIGTFLSVLIHLPYFLQLSFGITKLNFWKNVIAIAVLTPSMLVFSYYYGAVGGAVVWVLLNFFTALFLIPLMHRLILTDELWHWALKDVGMPLLTAALAALAAYFVYQTFGLNGSLTVQFFIFICLATALNFILVGFSIPVTRQFVFQKFLSK